MGRVSRRVVDREGAVAEVDGVAVGQRADPVGRDGHRLGVELPLLADGALRALDEPRGVDQVGRAVLVDGHGGVRAGLGQEAGAPRVVEVDVRRHDVRELLGPDVEPGERVEDELVLGPDAGVDDRRPLGVEEVDRGVLGGVEHAGVDVVAVRDAGEVDRLQVPDGHGGTAATGR